MNEPMTTIKIRKATREDLETIRTLLLSSKLPVGDIPAHLPNFLVAEVNGTIAGTIGIEIYEQTGLLRSASVLPTLQNQGIGTKLFNRLLDDAKEKGVKEILLLTTTAQNYFAKKGFTPVSRETITGDVLSSEEFKGGCPSTAICMRMKL